MKKLIKQIKQIEKFIKRGESIDLIYDGEVLPNCRYDFVEWTINCKTPEQWLRGCICFEISLKGLDINKVELRYNRLS